MLINRKISVIFTVRYYYGGDMTNKSIPYGKVLTTKDLGNIVRAHRKSKQLTLETLSGLGNLSTRFLSEFERGKETAEIGKVLKALRTLGLEVTIQPRHAPQVVNKVKG